LTVKPTFNKKENLLKNKHLEKR